MNPEKLARLQKSVRTGGKGSVRRKKKAVHRSSAQDDRKLQAHLKRIGASTIPGIDEVNMFKEDGTVIHFANPKVQAAMSANTFVVSGSHSTKQLAELVPGILNQLGADNLASLKKLAESMPTSTGAVEDDDDDVPDLVDNFEETSES